MTILYAMSAKKYAIKLVEITKNVVACLYSDSILKVFVADKQGR